MRTCRSGARCETANESGCRREASRAQARNERVGLKRCKATAKQVALTQLAPLRVRPLRRTRARGLILNVGRPPTSPVALSPRPKAVPEFDPDRNMSGNWISWFVSRYQFGEGSRESGPAAGEDCSKTPNYYVAWQISEGSIWSRGQTWSR